MNLPKPKYQIDEEVYIRGYKTTESGGQKMFDCWINKFKIIKVGYKFYKGSRGIDVIYELQGDNKIRRELELFTEEEKLEDWLENLYNGARQKN